MHKAKHHHAISGLFVVVSGVIGLSSIVSSMQVFAVTASHTTAISPAAVPAVVEETVEDDSTARAPFLFEVAAAGEQNIFENYPSEINQLVTYLTIQSQSDEMLELYDIDLDIQTNMPYKGAITLAQGSEDATIGLRVADTTQTSQVNIPIVRGILLPPHSSIVVAVAADNIPALGERLYDGFTMDISVNSIGWRVVASQDNQIVRAPVEFSVPTILFRPTR